MQKFDVNKLRVASPCSIGWKTMTGDERVRHCHACQLNIYNTTEMTTKEVEHLIENREGRLCIRLFRRSDGTVLTKDCPVGLRAVRKRIGIFAGAAMSAVLGLFSVSFGQKEAKPSYRENQVNIVRTKSQRQYTEISGSICDPQGAVIPGAKIKLYKNGEKKPISVVTNDDGVYIFNGLAAGIYRFEASASGFKTTVRKNLPFGVQEQISIDVFLAVKASVVVGLFADDRGPSIDITSTNITHTVFRRKDN